MASKTATLANFALASVWTNSGGAVTAGPSTDTQSKSFTISGIPAGATVQSAKLTVGLGSPYTGAAILTVNGETAAAGNKTFDLTPYAGGNGTYTVAFVFRANGAAGLTDGQHSAVVVVSDPTVTVTYLSEPPGPEPGPEPSIDWAGEKPFSVFAMGNEERFDNNGAAVLTPLDGRLKMVAGGACEVTFRHPIDPLGKWAYLVPGAIVRCPVPAETVENAFIGIEVDLYRTNQPAALREGMYEPTAIGYPLWDYQETYEIGSRVTDYSWGNFECIEYDGTSDYIMVPPHSSEWWRQIENETPGSPVLVDLPEGADLYFLENMGNGWYKMSTPMGVEGYVKSSQVTFVEHMTPQPADEHVIRDQLFRVKSTSIDTKTMEATVYAEHVSYDLAAILVKDAKFAQVSPAMALTRIMNSLMMPYRGSVATNLTADENGTYTGAINGKNGIFALLDPDSGIVPTFRARLIRDDWDLYVLKDTPRDRGIRMEYGKNVKGITWKRSAQNLVTRVVPVAKDQSGNDLYLPEYYVDSPNINDYPVIMMQRLQVKGQLGKDDGTGEGTVWTTETLFAEMRQKARERYDVDHADDIYVEITIDFEQLGDTVEYAWMKDLEHVLLYDTIHAKDERVGLETALKVTELEWDIIRRKITAVKLSTNIDYGLTTVAGYNIGDNSIGTAKLTEAAITEIANLITTEG